MGRYVWLVSINCEVTGSETSGEDGTAAKYQKFRQHQNHRCQETGQL